MPCIDAYLDVYAEDGANLSSVALLVAEVGFTRLTIGPIAPVADFKTSSSCPGAVVPMPMLPLTSMVILLAPTLLSYIPKAPSADEAKNIQSLATVPPDVESLNLAVSETPVTKRSPPYTCNFCDGLAIPTPTLPEFKFHMFPLVDPPHNEMRLEVAVAIAESI